MYFTLGVYVVDYRGIVVYLCSALVDPARQFSKATISVYTPISSFVRFQLLIDTSCSIILHFTNFSECVLIFLWF